MNNIDQILFLFSFHVMVHHLQIILFLLILQLVNRILISFGMIILIGFVNLFLQRVIVHTHIVESLSLTMMEFF
jgi:hypothetical protein